MYDELLAMLDSEFYADIDAGLTGADDTDDGYADYATYGATRYFAALDGIVGMLDDGITVIKLDGRVSYFVMASGAHEFRYHAHVVSSPYEMGEPLTLARASNAYGDWIIAL